MIIVLDTETTGLPKNYKAPITDGENWPRLVQIAWRTYENNGTEIDQNEYIVYPNGFDIPAEATALHGITTERALTEGISIESVLLALNVDLIVADCVVAHNIAYDEKIIGAEFIRVGLNNSLEEKQTICTMLSSVNFCAIPGPRGNKWPKLGELYQVLFAENLEGGHDAVTDCEAAARCFWELVEKGVIVMKTTEVSVDELFPSLVVPDEEMTENEYRAMRDALEPVKISPDDYPDFEYADDVTELKDIDTAPVWSPEKLQSEILDAYGGLDQTRMTLHHTEHYQWEAQRELDEINYQLRQTEEYKACKNEQQRADYLYANNQEAVHVFGIAYTDAQGAKLDFQLASDSVERVRALLRVAELAAGIERAR